MKRIVVGRATDCDIVIQDDADVVSRHHLVITINKLGRMTLVDTSSNGTLVNGTKLTKGVPVRVTRKDKVLVGDSELDWNRITDPYIRFRKNIMIAIVAIACLVVGCLTWYYIAYSNVDPENVSKTVDSDGNQIDQTQESDSIDSAVTKASDKKISGQKRKSGKSKSRRKKSGVKEVNKTKKGTKEKSSERKKETELRNGKKPDVPENNLEQRMWMRKRNYSKEKNKQL